MVEEQLAVDGVPPGCLSQEPGTYGGGHGDRRHGPPRPWTGQARTPAPTAIREFDLRDGNMDKRRNKLRPAKDLGRSGAKNEAFLMRPLRAGHRLV